MDVAIAAPARPARRSRKAVAALVLAILSALLGWVGLFIVFTPLAILFAVLALRDIRHRRAASGHSLAWAAIIVAVLAPIMWLLLFFVALIAGSGSGAYFG